MPAGDGAVRHAVVGWCWAGGAAGGARCSTVTVHSTSLYIILAIVCTIPLGRYQYYVPRYHRDAEVSLWYLYIGMYHQGLYNIILGSMYCVIMAFYFTLVKIKSTFSSN